MTSVAPAEKEFAMRTLLPLLFCGVVAASCLVGAAGKLPAFQVERWVNSTPLTAEALRGKVVLVDIWEYTCINWIRTSPYVKAWHRDYAALGLVVVGLHAPEFEFGKRAGNIDRGVRDHGLTYPIALDNDFATWRALGNDAWPAKYLYDGQGRLVKRWVGEGRYDEIEEEIRRQLVAAKPGMQLPSTTPEAAAFARSGQPSYAGITNETYVGSERREPGTFTLEGDWRSGRQYQELRKGAGKIVLPFTAGEVNLVMEPGTSGNAAVAVLLDGKPVGEGRGADVGADGVARIDRSGMFRLIAGASRGRHVLTLAATDPGLRAFVFTFGP
jgi:thiol-disulfide isomerase/thioredoxin